MAEVLAEVPWSPRTAFDLLRGAADAWFDPPAQGQSPLGAPWLASWATAAGLVSVGFAVYRAVSIPEMEPAGIFGWWWISVVAKVLLGALVLLAGVWLAWREHWKVAAVALTVGTGISILAGQWTISSEVPFSLQRLLDPSSQLPPAWTWMALYWPLQISVSVLAVGICATAAIPTRSRRSRPATPPSRQP
ncbi:MAG: hypothetical protein WA751_02580 [Candidatus Dormiibacterota bacterium]